MSFEAYNSRTQHQTPHQYTPAQTAFLAENVEGRGNPELMKMFNAHFGLDLSLAQIKAYKKNHGLDSGLDGRFEPGHMPANKGRKGVFLGGEVAEACQFKKGNKSWNWVPIGSERVNRDGYVDIKVDDGKLQKNWKGKHIIIWEEHNGPVPKGHAVIFGDGNRRNFDPDNLILVSRAQLAVLNKNRLIQDNADLTRTGIIVADIYRKMGERKKAK
ncbi:MAG: phage protein [Peptococcaceae bacterium BICA1-7]|nr:MAG: phage protein [Peptococcaceae bacterium BICA1-7]HBV97757.1 HNH endonuclease [Desulfotomaculum sp.]